MFSAMAMHADKQSGQLKRIREGMAIQNNGLLYTGMQAAHE